MDRSSQKNISKKSKDILSSNNDNDDKCIKNLLSEKEKMYYHIVKRFFKKCGEEEVKRMETIITRKYKTLSLRLIDWFVAKYSRFEIINIPRLDCYDLNISYKAQVKTHSKQLFDPFNRGQVKFSYIYKYKGEDRSFITSIGQLNFFKWAITNGIIDYIEENLDSLTKLSAEMNADTKNSGSRSSNKKQKNIRDNCDSVNDEPTLFQIFY